MRLLSYRLSAPIYRLLYWLPLALLCLWACKDENEVLKKWRTANMEVPTINGINPGSGPVGTSLAITGTNFSPAAASDTLMLGNTPVTVLSATSTQLTAIVPNLPPASYPVTVKVGPYLATATQSFTVTTPAPNALTITSSSPTTGPIGTTLTIIGTNFDATPTNNTLKLGTTVVPVLTATTTQLTATVPNLAVGTYTVTVTVNSVTATSPQTFTVTSRPAPTLISQTSSAGNPAGSGGPGEANTLTGTGFDPSNLANNVVMVDTALATVNSVNAAGTSMDITMPAQLAGGLHTISLKVNGVAATNKLTYHVWLIISSISATTGYAGDIITVTGKNFDPNPAFDFISYRLGGPIFGAIKGAITAAADGTSITVALPALNPGYTLANFETGTKQGPGPGPRTGNAGENGTGPASLFTLTINGKQPTLTSSNPPAPFLKEVFTLNGTFFNPTVALNTLKLSGSTLTISSVAADGSSAVVTMPPCNFPTGTAQFFTLDVKYTTPDDVNNPTGVYFQSSAFPGFNITPPTPQISLVKPGTASVSGGTVVTLDGGPFTADQTVETLQIISGAGIPTNITTFSAPTRTSLTFTLPAGTQPGTYTIALFVCGRVVANGTLTVIA